MDGVAPAPPPRMRELAVRRADDASVVVEVNPGIPHAFPVTVTCGVSGGIPYFSATTTESASALLASNSPVLGGGASVAPFTATFLTTNGANQFNVGGVGGGSGCIGLVGNTSGAATICAPAVAGTTTNPFVFSNTLQVPVGNSYTASIVSSATYPLSGISVSPQAMQFINTAGLSVACIGGGRALFGSTSILGFTSTTNAAGSQDTNLPQVRRKRALFRKRNPGRLFRHSQDGNSH